MTATEERVYRGSAGEGGEGRASGVDRQRRSLMSIAVRKLEAERERAEENDSVRRNADEQGDVRSEGDG